MGLTLLGTDRNSGRSIFLAESPKIEDLPRVISLRSAPFVLLLAYDEQSSASLLSQSLTELLSAGCIYLCAWGPGCEHVHDTMDEVALEQEATDHQERNLMTTWHATESLEEAARFALQRAIPDHTQGNGCYAVVLAAVGNHDWAGRLQEIAAHYVFTPPISPEL